MKEEEEEEEEEEEVFLQIELIHTEEITNIADYMN